MYDPSQSAGRALWGNAMEKMPHAGNALYRQMFWLLAASTTLAFWVGVIDLGRYLAG